MFYFSFAYMLGEMSDFQIQVILLIVFFDLVLETIGHEQNNWQFCHSLGGLKYETRTCEIKGEHCQHNTVGQGGAVVTL